MRLHLLSVPHTVTRLDFSHCAFGGTKVRLFSPMLRAQGYEVIHYGVEGAESGATEQVELMTQKDHLKLLGLDHYHQDPRLQIGHFAQSNNPCYVQFNFSLRDALKERLQPGDAICLPFGAAHEAAYKGLPMVLSGEVAVIETGIGYSKPVCHTRVYESEAWRHWILGNEQREGMAFSSSRLEWVVPNYYDLDDWPPMLEEADGLTDQGLRTVVYLGRVEEVKGCGIIPVLARARPDLHFVICGQGDPETFLTEPNIEYREPISGRERAPYLGNALCSLHPSRYVEPFCGAAVEAMVCGTPVLTSDFGAFTETVIDGVTGIRCRSVEGWMRALRAVEHLDRSEVWYKTAKRYSTREVGKRYGVVFRELQEAMARAQKFAPSF